MGADVVVNPKEADVVAEIKKLSGGGVDVAIEALGTQQTFENGLKVLKPGGTLSSLGVYSGKLEALRVAFAGFPPKISLGESLGTPSRKP